MAEIKSLLDEVIEEEIQNLDSISDREQKSAVIKDLTQLHKLRIEEIQAQAEVEEKLQCRRENKIDRWVKVAIAGVELVLPLTFYGIWMRKGFQFEETGSFTSTTFKNLLNRFRPTR